MDKVYINPEESLKRLGGKKALFIKLLNHFFADKSYENLLKSIDEGDMDNAQLHSHSIKGLGANLSLPALRESAAAVEASLKAGQLDMEAMKDLEQTMEETVAVIKRYISDES